MVPRRRGRLWRSGTRTDRRWFNVAHTRPVHWIYNPETFDDWRVEMDLVYQRECSPTSRLFTGVNITIADTIWLRGPYI